MNSTHWIASSNQDHLDMLIDEYGNKLRVRIESWDGAVIVIRRDIHSMYIGPHPRGILTLGDGVIGALHIDPKGTYGESLE